MIISKEELMDRILLTEKKMMYLSHTLEKMKKEYGEYSVFDGVEFYKALPYRSKVSHKLLEFAQNGEYGEIFWFKGKEVPKEMLEGEEILKDLEGKNWRCGILKMEPNKCYNWHVDTDRKVAINMILAHGVSHCVFMTGNQEQNFDVTELVYEPDTYYVLNTKKPHMVLNLNETRYMFSVEIME